MPARRRFGQNFLRDKNIINKIIAAVNPQPDEHILEIGPGHGALTDLLVESGCDLDVIEIDRDLARALRQKYPQLNVIEADILKFDMRGIRPAAGVDIHTDKRLRIVGNLPYNISTPLLFRLFEHLEIIEDMYFMLQLEVVDRITAVHSTSQYGRLSLMSQYFCEARKLFTVPADAFIPKPKVTSAIIRLSPKKEQVPTDVVLLQQVLRQAFSMRRKTIRNALRGFITAPELQSLGLSPKTRPENLTLADYLSIVKYSAGSS